MRVVIIALVFVGCGGDGYDYKTKHGIKVISEGSVYAEQVDVERATDIFSEVLPLHGRKIRPMLVTFGDNIDRLCPGMGHHVAGCGSILGPGYMQVLWIDGFAENAYFHELLHQTMFRLAGHYDRNHVSDEWRKIDDMKMLYGGSP